MPSYSRKNLLSPMRMWYTSLPEHRPYMRCHCSGDSCPSLPEEQGKGLATLGQACPLPNWLNTPCISLDPFLCQTSAHYMPSASREPTLPCGVDRDDQGVVVGLAQGTHWPRDVCTSRVMRVEVAGQMQFRASMAYLHSSSHTTWSVGTAGSGPATPAACGPSPQHPCLSEHVKPLTPVQH